MTLNDFKYALAKIYWFLFRPKTFGIKCLIEHNGEILMIKNSYGGTTHWMFPGGGIEESETAEQAVRREVFEEVGLRVSDMKQIGTYTSAKEYKRDMVTVFAAKSDGKDLSIDVREIATAQWFPLTHLPEISEYSKRIIQMYDETKH